MIFKQGDNSRVVLDNGTLLVEFIGGVADVTDEAVSATLRELGYECAEVQNDTDTKTDVESAGDKPKRGRRPVTDSTGSD